jgi:plastocyanin
LSRFCTYRWAKGGVTLKTISRARLGVAGATVVAIAVAGFAGGASAVIAPQRVAVGATEYHFTLSKARVKRGKVIFTIANKGTEVHDFKIIGKTPKSRFITGGQKTTLTLTFLKAGRYQYVCTIGEHAIKGMQGTLVVVK